MPIFEFLCKSCGHQFEELVQTQDPKILCPECGSKNLSKEFSVFGVNTPAASPCRSGQCDLPISQPCCGSGTCPGCDHGAK